MKANIPVLGRGNKNKHDLTHQVSTSSDFGFVQPVMCNEVEADSTSNIRIGQVVFMAPMVKPTFGKLSLNTYTSFVPCEDIWHAFGSFLSRQSYHGSGSSYIPSRVPEIDQKILWLDLIGHGQYTIVRSPREGSGTASGLAIDSKGNIGGSYCYISSQDNDYVNVCNGFLQAVADFVSWSPSMWYFQPYNASSDAYFCLHRFRSTEGDDPDYEGSITPDGADWFFPFDVSGEVFLAFGRFGQYSKNLLKIYEGCGYAVCPDSGNRSILPLVAFYKAWFDLFMPAREKTWKDTSAHALMEFIEQSGLSYIPNDNPESQHGDTAALFSSFLVDLSRCYYTQSPDYAAAHIVAGSNPIANTEEQVAAKPNTSMTTINNEPGQQAEVILGTDRKISQAMLRLLKIVDKRVNIRSVTGGRIDNLLKALGYGQYRDNKESNFIGSQSIDIAMDPLWQNAATDVADLGELAGRGIAKDSGQEYKFTAKSPGYIISLMCVVPHSRMAQGVDYQNLRIFPEDFFTEDYDAQTLVPTPKSAIYGEGDLPRKSGSLESGFGNIPLYTEYKFKKNIINGEMRMASTRGSYLAWNLDKLLPYTSVETALPVQSGNPYKWLSVRNFDGSLLVASANWRYIGKEPWLGLFNRIFQNEGSDYSKMLEYVDNAFSYYRTDDNFFIDCYVKYDKYSRALPVANSWQTDAFGEHIKEDLA